ncbi:MAG TPA: hypothetical protein VKC53_01460 [Patescibacteria group bacterium]|nr:hypothetical protein [Patescibacteria group bacterium]
MKEKSIFCVYFDKGFLLKGLALYDSLHRTTPGVELWVLALDKYTEKILKKMRLPGMTVVPMADFEDKELLAVKSSRSVVEYYWTCSPSWPLYIFKKNPDVKYVIYLDADLYFFSSAMVGVDEIGKGSLLSIEHRFPKGLEGLAKRNGRFNLAFNVFKNDSEGLKCLKRWRKQCLDWCYWKPEEGKMGDQGYLDEWPKLYKNLVISKNLGLDAAPWNISQYKVSKKNGSVFINNDKLVCYHFHQFQILGPKSFNRVYGYTLPKNVVEFIYKSYEAEIAKQYRKIRNFDKTFEIRPPLVSTAKVFQQTIAKYIGPIYWRFTSLASNFKAWLSN